MKPAQWLRLPLAALVPPALLILCVWLWAVDVLNWDEWTIWVGMLEKIQVGTFTLADLVAQQNEQRNLAARLFGLLLLPATGLNRLPECLLNLALAGAGLFFAARLYANTAKEDTPPAPLLPMSMLCFSLLQWESFSVGINSSVLLPPLGMWVGAALVAVPALTWGRLCAMILVGIIPSFCFVNGLFYWVCLAPVVALNAQEARLPKTATFLLAGAAAWATYFHGYSAPPHHPLPLLSLAHPLHIVGYFLTYLGGPLVGDKNLLPLAVLAGAAGLWLLWLPAHPLLAGLRDPLRQGKKLDREELARLAPWLAVAAFSLLSAGATALGRCGFGLGHALESRYASFSTPLWISVAALHSQRWRLLPSNPWVRKTLAACLALMLVGSILSAVVLHNRAQRLAAARAELFRLTRPELLEAIFPDPAYVALKLPLLLERRVGPYRDIRPLSAYHKAKTASGTFSLQAETGISGRICGYLATGRTKGQAGRFVLFALPERIAAVGQVEADGGFALFIPDEALPAGTLQLQAFVLLADGWTLSPLTPFEGFEICNAPCSPPPLNVEKYFYVR